MADSYITKKRIAWVRNFALKAYGHWIDEATAADLLRLAYGSLQGVLVRPYPPRVVVRAMARNLRLNWDADGNVRPML